MTPPPFPDLGRMPSRVALVYAACAAAWIVLSDVAMALSMGSSAGELWVDLGKGLLFVAASAGLMYVLLRRGLDREAAMRSDLAAKQERFHAAVAHLPFTFAIYDADRRFRFLNQQGLLIASKPLGEVLGRRDEEVFPLEMVNAYLPILNRALETRRAQTEVVEINLASGHSHLAYTFTPLLNADGTVREVLGVTHDMTVVVRNERRVRRLNRTLAAISAANSVLVRATDEPGLLRDFCAELAAQTGHPLVWVVLAEGADQLRVVAQAGGATGFLGGVQLGEAVARAEFPVVALALREQRPAVCRDFRTEEAFTVCRARAEAAGLRSAVGLPLCAEGRALGTLCLYAAEPHRFDEEELRMLVELADDLAFGLVALRRQRELALATERLRMLKLVIDQSASVAYVARAEPGWPVEYVSDNVARFGYDPDQFLTGVTGFADVIHPEDMAKITAELEQAVAEGKSEFWQEYRALDPRGEPHWIRDCCVIERDAAGRATHFRGVITDITEQRNVETRLRESEARLTHERARLEALLNSIPDLIFFKDKDSVFLGCNRAFEDYFGLPEAELIGKSDLDLLPRDVAEFYRQKDREMLASGQARRNEEWIPAKAGEARLFETLKTPLLDANGVRLGLIGISRDITARKRAEERAAELASFPERNPNPIVELDGDNGQLFYVNPAARTLFSGLEEAGLDHPWLAGLRELAAELADQGVTRREVKVDGAAFEQVIHRLPETGRVRVYGVDITARAAAEAALRASEERLRLALDAGQLGTYDYDIPANRIVWSNWHEALWGFQPGEFNGTYQHFESRVHPEDRAGINAEIARCVAGRAPFSREFRVVWPDGGTHWMLARGEFTFDAAGQPARMHGVVQERTAQKLAEAQIRDGLTYLGALLDASPVGIISYDETGQAQTANAAAARITGGTEEQLLALNFREIKSWRASGLLAAAERVLARRQPEQVEAQFTTTFGKEIHISAQFVPFQRGEAWHLLLLMTDVSEQVRATAQLQLQSAALEAAANAIVITDAQGTIRWANPAFTKNTGYSLAEAVGQNPRLLKSGKHPREFYEGLWKTILAGHVWHGELRNRRKDGTLYDEEMTIAPVKDAAGRVTHFIAIKQDITERKGLEQRFLRAQRLEGIGLLAGGIAHDLNNVLAPILMGADLLKIQARDQGTIHQLDSIVQSAKRGADIVKQVLTFARGIEGERVLLHPKHILKEMVRLARETFPRNIAFSTDIAGDLWPVIGDATQLHQVLLNLSVNARDAMTVGGTLAYSARNAQVDTLLAAGHDGAKPGPHIVLRVQDTGTGIPPEVLDRIFEPFFTTKELGKGTGLGLSTVIGIVRSHGGFVTVESEVGKGTAFEVWLPATPEAGPAARVAEPEPPPPGHGELVLVVDDEPGILQVTRAMLAGHGYRVLTAGDGTQALTELSRHTDEVALVITDILMPFMDGVQLIHALRRMAPRLRVIASSGALGLPGQKDRTDEVLALGVKHILHKPYSVETLLRTVHEELHPKAAPV